jgi:hypothetical protein
MRAFAWMAGRASVSRPLVPVVRAATYPAAPCPRPPLSCITAAPSSAKITARADVLEAAQQ